MSSQDKNNCMPLICQEAEKLYSNLESNQDKLLHSKSLLERKNRYLEQIQDQENDLKKKIAQKQASLCILQDNLEQYSVINNKIRSTAVQVCETLSLNDQELDVVTKKCAENETLIESMDNSTNDTLSKYEEQIDNVIKYIKELKEKREKIIYEIETKQKLIYNENRVIKDQIACFDQILEQFYSETDVNNEITALVEENKELSKKLDGLKFDYQIENKSEENQTELYSDTKFDDLDAGFKEIELEISQLYKKIDYVKNTDVELNVTIENCEKTEKKLNGELHDISKQKDSSQEDKDIVDINKEIFQIKLDILDRQLKYNTLKSEITNTAQIKEYQDLTIEKANSDINNLSLELNNVEEILKKLNLKDNFIKEFDLVENILKETKNEKENLNKLIDERENEMEKVSNQVKKEKRINEVELMKLKNIYLSEEKTLEKTILDLEQKKQELENEAQSNENIVEELKANLIETKAKQKNLSLDLIQLDKELNEAKRTMSLLMKNQLPKAQPIQSRCPLKPTLTKSKNWDSDSSVEVEEIKFNDFLKRKKYRKETQ